MKLIVYTALIGKYDVLKSPMAHDGDACSFICFSDQKHSDAGIWEIRRVESRPRTADERIRLARRIKMLPHEYLPAHTYSIWIDASLQLLKPPCMIVTSVGTFDISTFTYPDIYGHRDCVFQEAEACINRRKDEPALITEQMNRYRAEGYPEHNGLVETTLVVRRDCDATRAFNLRWLGEIERGSRRDQLSFNYVAWKEAIEYGTLPGCRLDNTYSKWIPHLENPYL